MKTSMVDLYALQAKRRARSRDDEMEFETLCENLMRYAADLDAARTRIVELEGQLKAREGDAGSGISERSGASAVSAGGGPVGDKGANEGPKEEKKK